MNYTRISGLLWVIAGLVFLVLAFRSEPRNNLHLALGVVFVVIGAARLRRLRA